MNRFHDRTDAGRQLAAEIVRHPALDPIVLGLPRGGVAVAYEVARALRAPLDIWGVRKIGVPWNPELGVGAVAEDGYVYLEERSLTLLSVDRSDLAASIARKQRELEARVRHLRGDRPAPRLRGRTVIVVDDGIATGGTAHAALRSIREQAPAAIVLAVPVAPEDTLSALQREVDEIVCLNVVTDLHAVGLWYVDFDQVSDERVIALLDRARLNESHHASPS